MPMRFTSVSGVSGRGCAARPACVAGWSKDECPSRRPHATSGVLRWEETDDGNHEHCNPHERFQDAAAPPYTCSGVAGAALAALAVWAIADPVAGVDLTVRQGPDAIREVGPAAVMLVSVLAGLAAWAALAVLERISSSARRDWTILTVVVLALSLTGPIAAATTTAGKAVLAGPCSSKLPPRVPPPSRDSWRDS
jgi:hypothetical protein